MKTLTLAFALSMVCLAQGRREINLKSWDFSHDGVSWEKVTVPHDWAIAGPFDKKWDIQYLAIEQDGQTKPMEHTGRSGGLPWIGKGEYKTTFDMPKEYKQAEIYFDGAMAEPVVYVNGKEAGRWAYGYNAFRIDISPFVKEGENEVLVKLQNLEESNRWYPGAGLFRPVHVIFTGKERINPWGTFFWTQSIAGEKAQVSIDTQIDGLKSSNGYLLKYVLKDMKGNVAASQTAKLDKRGSTSISMEVDKPQLWSIDTPHLYTLHTSLYKGKKLIDQTAQKVGIRTVSVTKEHGFQLNGVSMKFNGVCLHHDLGPLGAAVNKAAIVRQIKLMKDMGVNAIRTSHNMPSQMQMDVCDSLGMMVMAESFDGWKEPKVKNGYGRFYDEWWRKDLSNLVLGHRNHPSIVMWSIGNEIPEQWKKEGAERAKEMTEFCHSLDPTRTVTCGGDHPDGCQKCGFYDAMDVPGFNYRTHLYDPLLPKLKQGFLLGSETTSTVSSRGVYKFPVEKAAMKTYPDGQCSSYDMEYCGWSNLPDVDFQMSDDRSWDLGMFVWTGIDYLGEPTPYYSYWPSRSSYFGAVDLAGLPKDRYYLYRSVWNKKEHTVHLLPHWTWPGREGEVTPVYCYTDFPTAELFVNGKSQGKISKNQESLYDRYRLRWNDVKYEPGELKVVVYDQVGKVAGEQVVCTAGTPVALKLVADREVIKADGEDLCYVTVSVVDANGVECPTLDDDLSFEVTGAGQFKAVCNGDATSLESFVKPQMKLFSGKLVVTVQSKKTKGSILLKVKDTKLGLEKMIDISAI